jgi:diaminopimelate decarboxylase
MLTKSPTIPKPKSKQIKSQKEADLQGVNKSSRVKHSVKKFAALENWSSKINIRELYKKYGSPCWIVSKEQLTQNVTDFVAFTKNANNILFPVKTNPSLLVLELLAELGVGADCASRQEIDLALLAGIPYERISYNCPVQDVRLCENLLRKGATVVMDDPSAILELQLKMQGKPFSGKFLLRINPGAKIGYNQANINQKLMSHAAVSSKFGIPAEDLLTFVKKLTIPVAGLHVHVGTQMDNLESFCSAMEEMHYLAYELIAEGYHAFNLNIGGGLGIPFLEEDKFPSLKNWVEKISGLKQNVFNYYIEPGHALCGNTVSLLATVEAIKNTRNKRWVILNIGTDQLAKVTLLHWPHRILGAEGKSLSNKGTDAIAGPLCFAGDTLLDNIDAGDVSLGDPLLITHAGAYTFSLSNRFCGRLAPAWVLADGQEFKKLMDAEGRYDNTYLTNYFWNLQDKDSIMEKISKEKIQELSSIYLIKLAEEDKFEYLSIARTGERSYKVEVMTQSKVDFISMPFAIRIFGDATIVTLLHQMKSEKKEYPIWGRKLNLDCFEQVKTKVPLRFHISFSNVINEANNTNTVIARFTTECKKCSGSLVIKF